MTPPRLFQVTDGKFCSVMIPAVNWWARYIGDNEYYYDRLVAWICYAWGTDKSHSPVPVEGTGLVASDCGLIEADENQSFDNYVYSEKDLTNVRHRIPVPETPETAKMDELLQKAKRNQLTPDEKLLLQDLLQNKKPNG